MDLFSMFGVGGTGGSAPGQASSSTSIIAPTQGDNSIISYVFAAVALIVVIVFVAIVVKE